jgi:hypothetical protein
VLHDVPYWDSGCRIAPAPIQARLVRAFCAPQEVDKQELPPELQDEDTLNLLQQCPSVRDFIRDNYGLYRPPADYAALRAENLRRTKAAQKKG